MSKELSKTDIADLILYPQPLIFEIGCYDGKDSKELCEALLDRNYSPILYCFEADPRSQELFEKENIDSKLPVDCLILVPEAVGDIDGTITLHQSDSETRRHDHNQESWSASSSIKKPNNHLELFPDVQFNNTVEVKSTRLDTFYIKNFRGQLIDFMWVDINGAEEEFINGALGVLQHKTKYLYIEFSDKELYEGQITKDEILKKLSNFELVDIFGFKGNFGNMLLSNKTLYKSYK